MNKNILALLLLMVTATPSLATIVYDVNRTVQDGSVIGTITTNGQVGTLTEADIVDWYLTLSDGVNRLVLDSSISSGPGSGSWVNIEGTVFSATATELLFDFDTTQGPNVGVSFLDASTLRYWCFGANLGAIVCGPSAGDTENVQVLTWPTLHQEQFREGLVTIATASSSSSEAPEPVTIAMLGLGLAGLAASRRRIARR